MKRLLPRLRLLDATQPLDLLDRIGEGIFALDLEWRFSYLNRHAQQVLSRLSGSPSSDFLGTVIWDRPSLADSALGRALHRAHSEQTAVIDEVPDTGSRGPVQVRACPALDGITVLLRESPLPALTEQILDGMSEALLGCDHEWQITTVNARAHACLAPLGFNRSTLLGRNLWQVFPQLARSRAQAEAFRAHVQGSEVEFEEYVAPLGQWFSIRIAPTCNGLVCYARELPARSHAERALLASEERFRHLVESIEDVVFRLDRDQRCVDAFGRWLQREGIDSAKLIGLTTREIVGAEDAPAHERANLKALAGETVTYDWTLRTESGMHHMQTTLSPMRDAHSHIIGIVGVGRDVSQRVEASRELQRWARIFEHAGWGVAIVSPDGETIESVNPAFALMHGCIAAELKGKSLAELAPASRRDEFTRLSGLALERGNSTWESELSRRNGMVFPVLIHATAVKDADRRVIYYAVNVQDLTERRRIEEQVRQAQKMEAVGRLAGGVAHDFNNMMMIIMGFSDFLLTTLQPDDPRWGDADEIRKAADRAMQLTRQLLGFGRQQSAAREILSLNDVISGIERMLRPLLGEDIRLVTHLSVGLGAVDADYGQLEQVVMNLALNARDAMRAGGRLTVETLDLVLPEGYAYQHIGIEIPPGPYVMLIVSDTGQGMTPEVKARLFEPFFTTKPTTQNTGLGLATVYGIVAQSGGYIWVDSEPGKGTSFKICLPRVDTGAVVAAPVQDPIRPSRGSETILLVEDEAVVRSVTSRVLMNQGYVVLQASSGQEAIQLLQQFDRKVSLILADVVMPDMSGPELVARLLPGCPGIKVLYMSGYAEGDKGQPRENFEHALLQKPFSADSLVQAVRQVLDNGSASPA